MGTLRDTEELQQSIQNAGFQGITKDFLDDAIESLVDVGGVMRIKDGLTPAQAADAGTPDDHTEMTIAAGWNRVDVWTKSQDTKGLEDGLSDATDPGGWYRVKNAGTGHYRKNLKVRGLVNTAGKWQVRFARVRTDQSIDGRPYQDEDNIVAGDITLDDGFGNLYARIHLSIGDSLTKNCLQDERLQVEVKGPNGGKFTWLQAQFGCWRAGAGNG